MAFALMKDFFGCFDKEQEKLQFGLTVAANDGKFFLSFISRFEYVMLNDIGHYGFPVKE